MEDQVLNKFSNLDDPFAVSGGRTYLIGRQDGRFTDYGGHIEGEMGGMWSQPMKVLDGFWLGAVKPEGDVEWLQPATCFSSSPTACSHTYPALNGLSVVQETWVPHMVEALVVTFRVSFISTPSEPVKLAFLVRTDLQGTFESERLGWKNGQDEAAYLPDEAVVHAWDGIMPFHVVVGCVGAPVLSCETGAIWGPNKTSGSGVSAQLTVELQSCGSQECELTFVIASSQNSYDECLATWRRVAADLAGLKAEKGAHMRRVLAMTRLELPSSEAMLVAGFDWSKVAYDELNMAAGKLGPALAAGLPEFPWWFSCDNAYALQGALCVGRFDIAKGTLSLLAEASERANGNGRIIHEVLPNGVIYNPGNTQETAVFTMVVWDTFAWTGDVAFLTRMYPLCKQGILEWLLVEKDTDGDLLPEGYGITEVAGVNWELIDSAVYAHEALLCLGRMAKVVGDEPTASECAQLAVRLHATIEDRFWMAEEGLYADLIASPRMLIDRIPDIRGQNDNCNPAMVTALDAIEQRCASLPLDIEQAWLMKNWVVFCPLEVGMASPERALPMLRRMRTPEFTGRFGLYLSGINRVHAMSISTGVAAVCQARYGEMDASLGYMNQILATMNLRTPGRPSEYSPDYGCFQQAWTGYGITVPVVRQFFGLAPSAHERRLSLKPHLPSPWSRAALAEVRVGNATFGLAVSLDTDNHELAVDISCDEAGWTMCLVVDPAWYRLPSGEYELVVDGTVLASGKSGHSIEAQWEGGLRSSAVLRSTMMNARGDEVCQVSPSGHQSRPRIGEEM